MTWLWFKSWFVLKRFGICSVSEKARERCIQSFYLPQTSINYYMRNMTSVHLRWKLRHWTLCQFLLHVNTPRSKRSQLLNKLVLDWILDIFRERRVLRMFILCKKRYKRFYPSWNPMFWMTSKAIYSPQFTSHNEHLTEIWNKCCSVCEASEAARRH